MYRLFFIAKNNAKRQKGDIITLLVLSLLSAFILHIGISVLAGIGNIMDKSGEEHNVAHVYYLVPGAYADELEDKLTGSPLTTEFERTDVGIATVDYRNSTASEDKWSQYMFVMGSYEEDRQICKLCADTSSLGENDILLPYYVKPQFPVGDTIEFKFGDDIVGFNVAGYVEDPIFASPINIALYNIYVSDAALDRLMDEYPNTLASGSSLKFRCASADKTYDLRNELWNRYNEWLSADASRSAADILEVNWLDMSGGGQFMTKVVMAIFTIFAVIIMIIAIIIISFSIRNFIERNMKNTGIMEAAGYKAGELSMAIVLENMTAALIGSALGVVLAGVCSKQVGMIVALVSGMTWNQPYNVIAALATVAGLTLTVVVACLISARAYKKLSVLECLRGGISNHNFKRNYFAFEKTPLPIPVTLSLKELFGDKGRNIVLAAIIVILAISTNVGFALMNTFGSNTDALLDISGIECPIAQVVETRDFQSKLEALDSVDRVLLRYEIEPTFRNGDTETTVSCDIYDDPSLTEHDMIVEGRLPQSEKEICLTEKVGEELGAKVGDVIYIEYGGESYDFIISGFDQKINHIGRKGVLTDEGAQRFIGVIDDVTYYVYAKDGISYEQISEEIGALTTSSVDNAEKVVSETISTVSNSMYIICFVILIITFLIVIFVEILLVRSKIIRERRNFGVSKALGFTSGQLMVQTMISNIPAIIIGVVLGTIVSGWASTMLMRTALGMFGMKNFDVQIPVYGVVVTLTGILIVAMITSLISSLAIRNVEPAGLMREE